MRLAEVHRAGLRIVMVGQSTRYATHFHIPYTIIIQHLARYVGTCHPILQRHSGILAEPALQHLLDKEAGKHHKSHYQPDTHFFSIKKFLKGNAYLDKKMHANIDNS